MVTQLAVSQLLPGRDASLLTAPQAADFLGVSVDTLSRWRQQGGGPRFVKFTRAKQGIVRYRPADLERFIGEHVQESTSGEG
jgi:predicted site-specific integrase-resolvase